MYPSSSEPRRLQPWRTTITTTTTISSTNSSSQLGLIAACNIPTATEAGIQTTREKQRTDLDHDQSLAAHLSFFLESEAKEAVASCE